MSGASAVGQRRAQWKVVAVVVTLFLPLVAYLLSKNAKQQWRLSRLMQALDQQLGDFNMDPLSYDSMMPTELSQYLDNLFDTSRRWFETLDFQVGREMAAKGYEPKHPVVIIPGIISTGLESWTTSESDSSYFRQRLWGSGSMIRNIVFEKEKWVKHLSLDTVTGLDPEGIRVRAAKGLDAASYFAAGYWIWGKIIENLAAVGYDINMIYLASYDWRLSMANLEVRDHLYSEMVSHIELNTKLYKQKTVLIAHSMGSTVVLYFLKWVEKEKGAAWIDEHIEAFANVAGTMLGVPKAMSALMTGEMRDTVEVPPLLAYLLERFFSSHERTALFQSWAGSASMLLKGGDTIWGNHTWAPDDQPGANATHGNIYEYAVRGNVSATQPQSRHTIKSTKYDADEALPRLMQHGSTDFQKMLAANYSFGFERDAAQIIRNNDDPAKWTNPLEVALPNAPNLKIYCMYGWGKPTERSYWMRDGSMEYSPHTESVGGNHTDKGMHQTNTTPTFPQVYSSRIDARMSFEKDAPTVRAGCRMGEGDGTVSILSLGSMCVQGWKQPRYNPAGIEVKTHELLHRPDVLDLRGGPSTGDHVDILGAHDLNEVLLQIATGHGANVSETIYSPIRTYADRIAW